MLTLMKGQAGLTEHLLAEIALFGMGRAERRAAVVAENFCRAATRRARDILQTSYLDHSTKEIAHGISTVRRTFEQLG